MGMRDDDWGDHLTLTLTLSRTPTLTLSLGTGGSRHLRRLPTLRRASPISRAHLAHISPISPLYLAYISPTSPPVSPQELLRVIGCRASYGMPFTSRGLCRVVIHRRLRDFVRYTLD